jgi:8-oxo-dGTP pyrophosphatase MutT (NUDIX family)
LVTQWPDFDVERTSVRVVLIDAVGCILLFHTIDPYMPELGQWWELPGGGMDPGESYFQTAVREVFEETGIQLTQQQLTAPTWFRDATYVRRHIRTLQHEVVVSARIDDVAPDLVRSGQTEQELEEYIGHRWWPVAEIRAAADQRFFPSRLPDELEPFLAGTVIQEPFDHWN